MPTGGLPILLFSSFRSSVLNVYDKEKWSSFIIFVYLKPQEIPLS